MEHIKITGLPFDASRIGLGTWAIGGWLWGGTEESDAIKTIHAALDNGINSHRHRAGLWLRRRAWRSGRASPVLHVR